jgi:hypothetical protein
VQVVDDVDGVLCSDAFMPLYLGELGLLELMEEQFTLHEVVVFG